jgi:hypothetical protein
MTVKNEHQVNRKKELMGKIKEEMKEYDNKKVNTDLPYSQKVYEKWKQKEKSRVDKKDNQNSSFTMYK